MFRNQSKEILYDRGVWFLVMFFSMCGIVLGAMFILTNPHRLTNIDHAYQTDLVGAGFVCAGLCVALFSLGKIILHTSKDDPNKDAS